MVYSFDTSANSNYTLCIQRIFGVDVLFSPDIPPSVHRRPVPRRRRQPRQAQLALWPWSRGARRPSSPRPSRGMNVSREDSVRGQSKAGKGRPSHRSQGVRSQRNVHVRLEYNVVEVPDRDGERGKRAEKPCSPRPIPSFCPAAIAHAPDRPVVLQTPWALLP